MLQALHEILVILFLLACLAAAVAATVELACGLLGRDGPGRGFWLSLLGGTVGIFVLLLLIDLYGAITTEARR